MAKQQQDVLERAGGMFTGLRAELEVARAEAEEQVKLWKARQDIAETHILAALQLEEKGITLPTGTPIRLAGAKRPKPPTGAVRDAVLKSLAEKPGQRPRDIAAATGYEISQVGSALGKLKKTNHVRVDSGLYHAAGRPAAPAE